MTEVSSIKDDLIDDTRGCGCADDVLLGQEGSRRSFTPFGNMVRVCESIDLGYPVAWVQFLAT